MKTTSTKPPLAIFGAAPAFPKELYVGRPNLGNRAELLRRLNDALDQRTLTNNGPYVREFERRVASVAGVKHCIAVCNATVGLEILVRALELQGEVIVPAFTFVATAHSMRWMGCTPVFADVDFDTHLIDPRSVERAITPRTSAILGVHLWGQPCDVNALSDIAARHRLKLIFDGAHAFGATYGGRPVGGFGSAEVFSFHATKFVNSLEGGAIVTNDDDLARRVRLMINFGFLGYDRVGSVGTNGKMQEFSAIVGLGSIEAMDSIVEGNRRNYERYRDELAGLAGLTLLEYRERETPNYQYVVAHVDPSRAALHRDLLLDVLWAEGVIARRYFYPGVHRMEPYLTEAPDLRLPETERIADQILILPTGQTVDGETIARICDIIRTALAHADQVGEWSATRTGKSA